MSDPSQRCRIGGCQRHRRCMYTPCRATGVMPDVQMPPSVLHPFQAGALEAAKSGTRVVTTGRSQGKTLRLAQ